MPVVRVGVGAAAGRDGAGGLVVLFFFGAAAARRGAARAVTFLNGRFLLDGGMAEERMKTVQKRKQIAVHKPKLAN